MPGGILPSAKPMAKVLGCQDQTHPNLILTSKPSFFTSWLLVLDVAHLMTWNITHGHHEMLHCSRSPTNTSLPITLGRK